MVLSAQAWAELPPQTRATFEVELLTRHTLALRGVVPQTAHDEWHPPFFYLLEDALAQRIGTRQHLTHEKIDEIIWYWANVPTNKGQLAVGVPQSRIDSQPGMALLASVLSGLVLAGGFSIWLARRITAPLAQLAEASVLLGQGLSPGLLPD